MIKKFIVLVFIALFATPLMAFDDNPNIASLNGLRIVPQNTRLKTDDLIGQKSLIMFWKYDCPPCRVEILEFANIKKSLGNMPIIIIIPEYNKRERAALLPASSKGAIIIAADGRMNELMEILGNPEAGVPYSVMFDKNGFACIANLGPISAKTAKNMIKECK